MGPWGLGRTILFYTYLLLRCVVDGGSAVVGDQQFLQISFTAPSTAVLVGMQQLPVLSQAVLPRSPTWMQVSSLPSVLVKQDKCDEMLSKPSAISENRYYYIVLQIVISVTVITTYDIQYNRNEKAKLSVTNSCDAKPCRKLLQFDVETSYRQLNKQLVRPPGTLVSKAFCFSRDVFFIFFYPDTGSPSSVGRSPRNFAQWSAYASTF